MELNLLIGEIEVLVYGQYLPLKASSIEDQKQIAKQVSDVIKNRLQNKYGGVFSVELISTKNGCVKATYAIYWKKIIKNSKEFIVVASAFSTIVANLLTVVDVNSIPKAPGLTGVDVECAAKIHSSSFSESCIVKVNQGQTLDDFVSILTYPGVTRNQILVAIYQLNQKCFIDDNLNKLKANSILHLPNKDDIENINPDMAFDIVGKHNKIYE